MEAFFWRKNKEIRIKILNNNSKKRKRKNGTQSPPVLNKSKINKSKIKWEWIEWLFTNFGKKKKKKKLKKWENFTE